MRLFIAIEFDRHIKKILTDLRDTIRAAASYGSFTLTDNFHITLAFLGETELSRLAIITDSMDSIENGACTTYLSHLGSFRRPQGDIWWAGITPADQVKLLHREITSRLNLSGIWFDPKPFVAHLTLARSVRLKDPGEAHKFSALHLHHAVPVSSISLMQSERINGRLAYTPLHVKSLI